MWHFWIDKGGTFTDVIARKPDGQLLARKLLSDNLSVYEDAASFAVKDILGLQQGQDIPKGLEIKVCMGTTLATNMLLERKGSRVVLAITQGFEDILQIGYQNRPDLFCLDIKRPKPLYEKAIGVEQRMDANGNIIVPLNRGKLKSQLSEAYSQGFRSISIAFIHSFRFPQHEMEAADIARDVGFSFISQSHLSSQRKQFIYRASTSVADAYLSPGLKKYTRRLGKNLFPENVDNGNDVLNAKHGLAFMQSSGGLVKRHYFHGHNAVLSGPAGGVIATAHQARHLDSAKVIGLDMGGTSTDVCLFDGEYARCYTKEIDGVLIQTPMMDIHTIAAGGSSILSFSQGRCRVGPHSAAAQPGPVCYMRGGPLTITDCNVVLGRIIPLFFPKVFGSHSNQPINKKLAQSALSKLADIIQQHTQQPADIESVAEGFLQVAIENIANAVKKISIQRGHDPRAFSLHCFGGASGQIACQTANLADVHKIIIHRHSGIQSAFGVGLAEIRCIKESSVDINLSQKTASDASVVIEVLSRQASTEIVHQGADRKNITLNCQAHLRYDKSLHSFAVPFGSVSSMSKAFIDLHRSNFGFIFAERDIHITVLSAEAIATHQQSPEIFRETKQTATSLPVEYTQFYFQGRWIKAPLFVWKALTPGQKIQGPAMIVNEHSSIVLEPEWRCAITPHNTVVMERTQKRSHSRKIDLKANPVMLEVFNNRFVSIAEQMGAAVQRTAMSINIKERLDFSCALFDAQGNLTANAPHIPVHLGSMEDCIKSILENHRSDMRPGDAYITNSPYSGGTHLPDITVVMPVFYAVSRQLEMMVGVRAHHTDIGGKTPGSLPTDSSHICEEGVLIEDLKLIENNVLLIDKLEQILRSKPWPCRNIKQNLIDIYAQISAARTGIRELKKMIAHFGLEAFRAYTVHIQKNAETVVRNLVCSTLKEGSFTKKLDHGDQIHVAVTVDKKKRSAVIDFRGTSKQNKLNYNAPRAVCKACVLYVLRTLINEEIPLNSGCLKPLSIIIPKHSILNPTFPAAVVAGNTEISQSITDALFAALGVMACSQGTMNNVAWGNKYCQNYETICGGSGAGIYFDGCDAVQCHMTNTRMTDPEALEWEFPVRVDSLSIRRGSGGKGKHQGGDGVVRKLRFLQTMTVSILSSHRTQPPFGMNGGTAALCGKNQIIRGSSLQDLAGNDECTVHSGDMLIIHTPGGGGFGRPDPPM